MDTWCSGARCSGGEHQHSLRGCQEVREIPSGNRVIFSYLLLASSRYEKSPGCFPKNGKCSPFPLENPYILRPVGNDWCGKMPKGMRKAGSRVGIRIPKPMTDEISRIIDSHPALYYNRQQFVETAIREKIERIRLMEQGGKPET